jgi:hypothetical protein
MARGRRPAAVRRDPTEQRLAFDHHDEKNDKVSPMANPLYEMDDVIKHRLCITGSFLPPGFSSRKMTLVRPRFGSLPGAGSKITPRLLGEIGSDRSRFEDPEDCGPGAIILSHDPCYNRVTLGHSGFFFD